jgi:acetylornithine deacetylase/succinyl-diaminopimelate desuccinylase-like protein
MVSDKPENLFKIIEGRRDELVELTRALIRFPNVNPPGEVYRPCAEFIGRRLSERGFAIDLAHQPDEYALIDDLVASAKVMAMAARSLLLGIA